MNNNLEQILNCLREANAEGMIVDTIWMDDDQTLFDFIELCIEEAALTQQQEAEPVACNDCDEGFCTMNCGPAIKFHEALKIVESGFREWADKPHNNKWVKRISGTPIENDLAVCIAGKIATNLPKPAAQPVAGHLDDTRNFLSRHLNEINKAEDGDRDHDLERHLEIALSAMSAAQPQVPEGMELAPEGTIQKAHAYLSQAADDVEGWGAYASDYFQKKHDLKFDIELWKQRSEEFRLLAESAAKEGS